MPPQDRRPFGPEDTAMHDENAQIVQDARREDGGAYEEAKAWTHAEARKIVGVSPFPHYQSIAFTAAIVAYNARLRYLSGLPGMVTLPREDTGWLFDESNQAHLRDALFAQLDHDQVDVWVGTQASSSDDSNDAFGVNPTEVVVVVITPKKTRWHLSTN